MKIFLHLAFSTLIAGILCYLGVNNPDYGYVWFIILLFAVIGEFAFLANMRKRSSGDYESSIDDKHLYDEKIDFAKNSPTINPQDLLNQPPVKPIDLTGNVFEHNVETLEEDLGFLKNEEED